MHHIVPVYITQDRGKLVVVWRFTSIGALALYRYGLVMNLFQRLFVDTLADLIVYMPVKGLYYLVWSIFYRTYLYIWTIRFMQAWTLDHSRNITLPINYCRIV